ncbi:RNA-binding protein 5 isoform 2-T3 [Pholidichthys leucotaenia]
MWDGPGPWEGPPFRGDHRGERFGGREHHMPDYRDEMSLGHMAPRPYELPPPMDMRRVDRPPMRGHDMDPHDMLGVEPDRDFYRHGEELDFAFRRHFEAVRDALMHPGGFPEPGRPSWDPNNRFMDVRDRHPHDMPWYNNPNIDGRRVFPEDRMEQHEFRDMYGRPPVGFEDIEPYGRDFPPHDLRLMDTDRRVGAPFSTRSEFDSDMDFRNRPGPSAEFRGRERSPLRFGNNDVPPVERPRPDIPSDVGARRSEFVDAEYGVKNRDYGESRDSPVMDYRGGEEMTLAEEWKSRRKDSKPYVMDKGIGGIPESSLSVGFDEDENVGNQAPFQERDKPCVEFPRKDVGFPHDDHFPAMEMPLIDKGPQDHNLPERGPLSGPRGRENENNLWLGDRDSKHIPNKSTRADRPPYHQEKNRLLHEIQEPHDRFGGMKDTPDDPGPDRGKLDAKLDFQTSSTVQARDQDYRDIDYRTGTVTVFDYKHEDLHPPEKLLKESKPITPSKFNDSGSQDQDYRSASVEDNVSNIISVTGIPKSATVEQILGAFVDRDGVPKQGMKIKHVVPGYSYDTAYVEFLNLEDAVHFMESNKGSMKLGTRMVSIKYIQPDKCEEGVLDSDRNVPQHRVSQLPTSDERLEDLQTNLNGAKLKDPSELLPHSQWQHSSDLTPEAWQQQVDQQLQQQEKKQQAESWNNRNPSHHSSHPSDSTVNKDSKTMVLKNLRPSTTVETILKALDPFAYLDERNVRLIRGKHHGSKSFCFVDMDSHEQVVRLIERITKPIPLCIDGVRVFAEVATPLKNQNFRRDFDKPSQSTMGYPREANMMGQQQYPPPPQYVQHLSPPASVPTGLRGDTVTGIHNPALSSDPSTNSGFAETPNVDPAFQAGGAHVPSDTAGMTAVTDGPQPYVYGSETPDVSNYLYDATSGFYYDPETTLYYDPSSRYFYNAQTQDYLYWDGLSKTYIPVPGGHSAETQPVAMTPEDQAILSNPAADAPLEMKKPPAPPQASATPVPAPASAASPASEPTPSTTVSDKKEEDDSAKKEKDNKEEKPKSLAAVKIMKDMERWAKIQNRQKETVRAPSPVLKTGVDDEKKQSKSADAAFAIFERKISGGDDLFKKPMAPVKPKEEKSKRMMGSLGMLASDYAAGSDEEVEEEKEEVTKSSQSSQSSQPEEKDDKLTDWKKMACLLCRRQFPNKDALIRHQQLSDLHKQNMEIHLKIKRSKKELEALENQEKEMNARESSKSPEPKRRKQQHSNWAGSSRETNKVSERPGLGAEPVQRKKKEPVVWTHATYKQAVRKAMFARFKELE